MRFLLGLVNAGRVLSIPKQVQWRRRRRELQRSRRLASVHRPRLLKGKTVRLLPQLLRLLKTKAQLRPVVSLDARIFVVQNFPENLQRVGPVRSYVQLMRVPHQIDVVGRDEEELPFRLRSQVEETFVPHLSRTEERLLPHMELRNLQSMCTPVTLQRIVAGRLAGEAETGNS